MKSFIKKEKPTSSTSEETSSQRPKRSTCQKNLDGSNGLLWREETDLKRALYASLQETRRRNLDEDEVEDSEDLKTPPVEEPVNEQDEILKKAKVHAQRKFAQGSNPNSPVPTPLKVPYVNNSTTELIPYRRPKTEDFLTFLCLRGTSILPPSLDFLNCCSKSDTSSECRSLSPDLEVKECSNAKETVQKTSEVRERSNTKYEGLANGVSRKLAAYKASSKRHSDSSQPIKKSNSKMQKEVSIIRKRKSRDEQEDVEFIPSNSVHLKTSVNGRTRSSTLHALREKYKRQRLAADKKKLLPPKQTSQSSNTKTSTRSQGATKQSDKASQRNASAKNTSRSSPPVFKTKQSRVDKKLAVEKRKSLRSARSPKGFAHRKLLGSNKKTMWSRRAKLVPPIVDVDSDSEPEIISTAPTKKAPPQVVPNKQNSASNSARLSERLRNRGDTSKHDSSLTSRQILLRKHMQSRLKAKKSALHSQNIKSKVIVKKIAKHHILKKAVRKSLASKTMSLRKDLQNKRVTRSAKHQIEEMLWSNPEKRSKLSSNSKSFTSTKVGKKRASLDSVPTSKKPKLSLRSKNSEKQINVFEKEVKSKSSSDTGKTSKQSSSFKPLKKFPDSAKLTRSLKSASSIDPKPCCSTSSDNEVVNSKSKTENLNKTLDHKISKPFESRVHKPLDKKVNKHAESKVSKFATKGNKSIENQVNTSEIKKNKPHISKSNKPTECKVSKTAIASGSKDLNSDTKQKSMHSDSIKGRENNVSKLSTAANVSKNSNVTSTGDLKNNLKSTIDKDLNVLTKENNLGGENSNVIQGDNEANVQNNLNLQKSDKNISKDISQLIYLNVECEEPMLVPYSEPGCSGIGREEKNKKINIEKDEKYDSKSEHVPKDGQFVKKHSDKKYLKNSSSKQDKVLKKTSDKNSTPNLQDLSKNLGNNKIKSEFKDAVKSSAKSESRQTKIENILSSDSDASMETDLVSKYKAVPSCSKVESSKYVTESRKTTNNLSSTVKKDVLGKNEIEIINYSHLNNTDHSPKIDQKKDSKKQKVENKEKCEISPECNNFKRNCEHIKTIDKNKITDHKWDQGPSTAASSCQVVDQVSDDDSDYDITLDQYIKLKSENHVPKSSSTAILSPVRNNVNRDHNALNVSKDSKSGKKESEKDAFKSKKEGESSKHKKDKDNSKSKSHDKSLKKEDKMSRKDAEKSLAKLLKRERSKSNRKEEKERLKHKRDGSSSSKSSKRELEKDGSKLNKKELEKESSSSEKRLDGKVEFSDKKEKSSKKESSKLSRSNSCEDSKSPKKKKKFNEFKDIEKIKNLISKSSILNEISGFKEFKRRLSSDKSELKKRLSKSKKRKKLALLKEKKLSKKLSSKLLRKYSKKKGLKKKKLKKKELKKGKINLSGKLHSKNKKQKHKIKGEHHRRDSQEKIKISDQKSHSSQTAISDKSNPTPSHLQVFSKSTETQLKIQNKSESVTNHAQTSTSDIITPVTYVIETFPETCPSNELVIADVPSHQVSTDSVSSNENCPTVVSSELNSACSEPFPTGTILLTTRDSIAQVPLHFIQDIPAPPPKTMADAATNTCDDDLDESLSPIPEHLRSDEMSVGTQTITPVGSPSPTAEMRSIVPSVPIESSTDNDCIIIHSTTAVKPSILESNVIPSPFHPLISDCVNKSITTVTIASSQLNKCSTPTMPVKPIEPMHVTSIIPITLEEYEPPVAQTSSTAHEKCKSVDAPTSMMTTKPKSCLPIDALISTMPTKSKTSLPVNAPTSTIPPKSLASLSVNDSTPTMPSKSKASLSVTAPTPVTPVKSKASLSVNAPTLMTPVKSKASPSVNTASSTPVASEAPALVGTISSTSNVTPVKSKATLLVGSPCTSETLIKPKSASSANLPSRSSSPKVKKRNSMKKLKIPERLSSKPEPFPLDTARMVAAPVFYPRADEFNDPLEYISKIRSEAEQYGICKIVPPPSFKPECKVNDDMRFTAHNQYLHKMLYRWGPNIQDTACIKKHLKTQKVKLEQAPLIGGIELDISKFYHKVQQFGGLQQVIEKKRWQKVADAMRVPKTAQDRVTKLYDAYCKYLVSYDTLPSEEKQKLEDEVVADHEKRLKLRNSPNEQDKEEELDDEENNDCVTKGRSMSLSNFFRIARNTMSMWFKNEPSPEEVEHELWKIVTERQQHMVVHAGNIDSAVTQSGFPTNRSPFAKHPWNLKVLTNNNRSILRSMGPISGITIPTLHVGMLFTTGCWYRDPHSCPWIEYLHTGASKIWYGVPANGCEKFRSAMMKIMPEYCSNRPLWLSVDTAMVPPELLVKHGASLSRTIQTSGQFVVIFPGSFTSSICCGYCVSESVYFAPILWLDIAQKAFQDIRNSCESPAFALERLLFSIVNDPKPQLKILEKILPMVENIRQQELNLRAQLNELGLKQFERLPLAEVRDKKKKSKNVTEECEQECDICRTPCYVSMVVYPQEDSVYCPPHAIEHIQKKNMKLCKLKFTYSENDLNELVKRITDLVSKLPNHTTSKKKSPKKKTLTN